VNIEKARLVLCFGVVNEVDVIREFIEYHLNIGIDAFVGTDVGSTDGTLDVLCEYERAGCLHLLQLQCPDVRPDINDWASAMVGIALEKYEPEWCLFCDADEFWVFPDNAAQRYLAATSAPIVIFPRYNMLPRRESEPGRVAHFSRFDLVVRRPLHFAYDLHRLRSQDQDDIRDVLAETPPEILRSIAPKVIARPKAISSVVPGFHDVISATPLPRYIETDGYVAHFPARSVEQWRKKAELVYRYIAQNPPEIDPWFGGHWVRLAAVYQHNLLEEDFTRQLLSEEEAVRYLQRDVLQRDVRVSSRLAALSVTARINRSQNSLTGISLFCSK